MKALFAPLRRTLAALALLALATVPALAQTPPNAAAGTQTPPPSADGAQPAGGHFKQCHGYVRHVSDLNIKVHCIDGNASDQSFVYFPHYTSLKDGKSMQTQDLLPDTPVHIIYTQSLGVKKAYKIYVADPNGQGVYGFRS